MVGKKKKKPAVNPARGFATVSQPSKAREPVTSNARDEARPTVQHDAAAGIPPSIRGHEGSKQDTKAGATTEPSTKIEDMTPQELERHLERAELESLFEQNASRVKTESARQVAKLTNERRQLRQLADKLIIHDLPKELQASIMSSSSSLAVPEHGQRCLIVDIDVQEKDVLPALWTLHEVLTQLNLPYVDKALLQVLRIWRADGVLRPTDYIPGLVEVFEWYAGQPTSAALPGYDTGKTDTDPDEVEEPGSELDSATEEDDYKDKTFKTKKLAGSDAPTEAETSSIDQEESDDSSGDNNDDNDDPDQLANRWLYLQRKKFWLQQKESSTNAKRKAKLATLESRLQSIERDILFEQDVAQQQWRQELKILQIERAQARKAHNSTNPASKGSKKDEEKPSADLNVSDDEDVLGGMFDADLTDALATSSSTVTETVTVHDFGSWTGTSPRRLLEEAISSLTEPNAPKFRPHVISPSSAQLQLDISWNTRLAVDEHARLSLPDGIVLETRGRRWSLKMQSVATKSTKQSEAFLATTSLFLLAATDLINSKIFTRLPKMWKEMYEDLQQIRNAAAEKVALEKLERLRTLIRTSGSSPSHTSAHKRSEDMDARTPRLKQVQNRNPTKLNADAAKEAWSTRAQRRAFEKMRRIREALPVFQYKQQILEASRSSQILIICADTGAGKSTQIPSYILESELQNGRDCSIMVTQPRRISAISIAKRVSFEMGEEPDAIGTARSLVGYAIRLESKTSSNTRITFATTGVLLRMIQESRDLDHLDYLVLDEVHERTMDLDLLFIVLKRLQERRSSLKIILMSATVDATKFSTFFGNAPILDIPGRTFPVEVGFLEDAIEETSGMRSTDRIDDPEHDSPAEMDDEEFENNERANLNNSGYSLATQRLVAQHDLRRINYDLIVNLATAIATKSKFVAYSKALLVFMPGIGEIRRLHSLLVSSKTFSKGWTIHTLHSSFSTQDLEQAFLIPPPGMRKVVIATNIAETGITIPDITAVIDTCKEKVMRFDDRRQLSRLTEGIIARSNARQRRGRAARVQDGLCFHLVTRHHFETKMAEQSTPEILRLSLQEPILRVKVWKLGSAEEVLSSAIDPPTGKNIRRALSKLEDVGAIDAAERLTPLGRMLSRLPLDVALGKMAIYGIIFQCLDAIITIIATFSVKSIFAAQTGASTPSQTQNVFAHEGSDFLTAYSAYSGWKKAVSAGTGQNFCHKYHLSQVNLQQVEEQKIQLLIYLSDAGLVSLLPDEHAMLNRARNSRSRAANFEIPERHNKMSSDGMISAAIVVALYPKILRQEGNMYRNVYTNQYLQIAPTSIVRTAGKRPRWACYLEAAQSGSGKLNASYLSNISPAALVLLFGEASFKMYSGVVDIDNGKIRLSLRSWQDMLVLQQLRYYVHRVINQFLASPEVTFGPEEQRWLDHIAVILNGPPVSRVPIQ